MNLAETLVALRKDDEAANIVDTVLAQTPTDPEALGAKGRLLAAKGQIREALPFFEQATATSDPEPSIELARAYLAAGDPGKAVEAANQALRKSSGHPWAMAVLGDALVRTGQRSTGLDYLNRAVAIGPRRPIVWQSLAEGFDAAHDPAQAQFCRRQAAALAAR